jgi:predicted nucleic acid-binding protein
MLLLDTSFLIELEDALVRRHPAAAVAVLAANRRQARAIGIITLSEFAEGFTDPQAFGDFVARFRVLQLSRVIAWRAAMMQSSLPRRLGGKRCLDRNHGARIRRNTRCA